MRERLKQLRKNEETDLEIRAEKGARYRLITMIRAHEVNTQGASHYLLVHKKSVPAVSKYYGRS